MWTIAFFGAGTAYIEASLGQIYKEKIDGNYRGGPAYYILKGLKKKTAFYMINLLRIVMLTVTFFTAINAMTLAWNMADIGVGIMAWLNLIAIVFLQKVALKTFFDFENQYRSGIKDPVFHPENLGIENAEVWKDIN